MRVFAPPRAKSWKDLGEWVCVVRYGDAIGSVVAVGSQKGCQGWIGAFGPSVVVQSDTLEEV